MAAPLPVTYFEGVRCRRKYWLGLLLPGYPLIHAGAYHAGPILASTMLKEFKEFALKGNMVDMAIGIIIGAAFATVVASLVNDVVMPIIAAIFQAPDFSNLFAILRNPTGEEFTSLEAAREAGAVAIAYGLFVNALIAFLLVALVLFFVVRSMNRLMKAKAEAAEEPDAPPAPTAQEVLLAEIRDLLKAQRSLT